VHNLLLEDQLKLGIHNAEMLVEASKMIIMDLNQLPNDVFDTNLLTTIIYRRRNLRKGYKNSGLGNWKIDNLGKNVQCSCRYPL
jgi:hypothetical protein